MGKKEKPQKQKNRTDNNGNKTKHKKGDARKVWQRLNEMKQTSATKGGRLTLKMRKGN